MKFEILMESKRKKEILSFAFFFDIKTITSVVGIILDISF
jgi:hypothetical protein